MEFAKIRGKSYQDCLMEMKMKYGSEATVISQTVVTEGGVMGTGLLAKKMIEIQIGIPEKTGVPRKDRTQTSGSKGSFKTKVLRGSGKKENSSDLKTSFQNLGRKRIRDRGRGRFLGDRRHHDRARKSRSFLRERTF